MVDGARLERVIARRVETGLRGSLEVFDLAHPAGQWVPSGENLGHQTFISGSHIPQVAEAGAVAGVRTRPFPLNVIRSGRNSSFNCWRCSSDA